MFKSAAYELGLKTALLSEPLGRLGGAVAKRLGSTGDSLLKSVNGLGKFNQNQSSAMRMVQQRAASMAPADAAAMLKKVTAQMTKAKAQRIQSARVALGTTTAGAGGALGLSMLGDSGSAGPQRLPNENPDAARAQLGYA